MTAKRFTYDSKTVSILKDGEFWLDGNVDTACNHSEICNELNALNDENEQLQHDATILIQSNQDYRKENEELKKELNQFYLLIGKGDWSGLVDLIKGDVE